MPELRVDGQRLKELREAYPLTQGQLATKAKLKQDHISKLETGRRHTVRFATLEKLANALSVPAYELLVQGAMRRRQEAKITREDVREAVTRAMGGQSTLSEQAMDRIVTEIMRQEIKKASEEARRRED